MTDASGEAWLSARNKWASAECDGMEEALRCQVGSHNVLLQCFRDGFIEGISAVLGDLHEGKVPKHVLRQYIGPSSLNP